jgi:hypothetical protein
MTLARRVRWRDDRVVPTQSQHVTSSLGLELKGLYDVAKLARELGISRRAAEAICRQIPKQYVPGLRKAYVRGADVQQLLDDNVTPT